MAGKQRMIQLALVLAAGQILSGNSPELNLTGIETNHGQTAQLRCLAIFDKAEVFGYSLEISSESNDNIVRFLDDSMQRMPCLNSTVSMLMHWSNVSNVAKDKNYTCSLKKNNRHIANDTVNGLDFVKDPPIMGNAPRVVNLSSTHMEIVWNGWREGGGGDGPVKAYIVYMSNATGPWTRVYNGSNTRYTQMDLTPYAQYKVSVAARRPGPGGEGNKSNITMITTNCTSPNKPVFGVRINYNYLKSGNTVKAKVSWQAPPSSDWNCANISRFEIIVNKSQIENTSVSTNISQTLLAESVLLRVPQNGSQETNLPPATTELLLTTEAGPDGIYYTDGGESSIVISDLTPLTQYNFTIRYYNNEGYPSPDTTEGPSRTPGPESWWTAWRIGAISGGGAAFLIIVVIVIILLVRARRRRKSRARSNAAPSAKALDEMVRKQNKGNKGKSEGAGGDGMRPQSEHLYEAITFKELEEGKPSPKKKQPAPKAAASDHKTPCQPNKYPSLQRPSEAKPNEYQTEKMPKQAKKAGGQTGAPPRGQNTAPGGGPKKQPNQAKPSQSRSPAEKGSRDETKQPGHLKPPNQAGPGKTSTGVKVGPGNLKPVGQSGPGKSYPGVKAGPGNSKPPGQAGKGRTPPGVKGAPGQTGLNKDNARRDQTRSPAPGVGRGRRGQAGQGGTTPGRSVKKPQGRGKPPTPDPPPEQYYMPLQTDARC